jgi:hypothetical protein
MYNPYGGNIVTPPRLVRGTNNRLGSVGWRLTDTSHGKAMRRKRKAIASAGERILPTLSDEQTDTIMAQLREQLDADRVTLVNNNIHNK